GTHRRIDLTSRLLAAVSVEALAKCLKFAWLTELARRVTGWVHRATAAYMPAACPPPSPRNKTRSSCWRANIREDSPICPAPRQGFLANQERYWKTTRMFLGRSNVRITRHPTV